MLPETETRKLRHFCGDTNKFQAVKVTTTLKLILDRIKLTYAELNEVILEGPQDHLNANANCGKVVGTVPYKLLLYAWDTFLTAS